MAITVKFTLKTVPRTISFPTTQSFLAQLSQHIIETNNDQLPDLSHINVFIANKIAADQLRQHFLDTEKNKPLITPYIGSMSQWINNHIPLANSKITIISQQSRRLLFLDAISQHPDLFKTDNNWQVCDALLNLFDELTNNNAINPELTANQWSSILNDAYGTSSFRIKNQKIESEIIYTLWHAWHEQMNAMMIMDESSAYVSRLNSPLHSDNETTFYIIGPEQLSNAERQWCEKYSAEFKLEYIVLDIPPSEKKIPESETDHRISDSSYVNIIYDHTSALNERYSKLADNKALNQAISIFTASSYEQEAQAIEIQTRLWLLAGYKNIAIISEDRKIARRVRALLDRAGVPVQDTAGWALSTTSASTTVERWLECIEEDFPHQSLLDLIKSPFFCNQSMREDHLEHVYHFEHDIVIHENIARDLRRYKRALINRKHKLENWPAARFEKISLMLESIEAASATLRKLHSSGHKQHPETYLNALITSLDDLNITTLFESDKAGKGILSELKKMITSLKLAKPAMSWQDFRTWLASTLENEQLILNVEQSAVKFMNFQQAQYCTFDALIVAGANKDKLPGKADQSAFFNQSVKASLGLKDWGYKKNYFFYRFKCTLSAADNILITYRGEDNGEWLPASPWVTSLQDLNRVSTKHNLNADYLSFLVSQNNYISDDSQRTTCIAPFQPTPGLVDTLKPEQYSASHLQRIINCPYQFFTTVALSLKAPEHISEELRKSEYGEKIHAILYAFHQQKTKSPYAFKKEINAANREIAIQHLTRISADIFRQNIEDNIQHRSWLRRWIKTIPAYIDWQIKWQNDWSVDQLETEKSIQLHQHIIFKGRPDRIDLKGDSYSIIDYKTGATPTKNQIISGEEVQLLCYASLIDQARSIVYLKLDNGDAKAAAQVDEDNLERLKLDNRQRMINIVRDIQENAALSAWGDNKTCERCDSHGLCRKQIWENT